MSVGDARGAERLNDWTNDPLRRVLDSAPLGVFVYSLDLRGDLILQHANPAASSILGVDCEALVGMTIETAFPPLADTEIPERYRRAAADGVPWHTEQVNYEDDRIQGAYEVHAFQSVPGTMVVMFQDITKRKQTEEALECSERRLSDLIFSTADWVWEVDANGTYTYCSPQVEDILGYRPSEIVGKTPFDLMPPQESERVRDVFKHIVDEKAPIKELENWNLSRDGETVYILTDGVPILDVDGNLLGYRGVDRDITARKQAEDELRRSRDQLAAAYKELESFSYSVSHDLRAPLRSIDGFSQAVLEDCRDKLDDQGRDYLSRLSQAAQKMGELIDDMLKLSRLSQKDLRLEAVDLSRLARDLDEEMRKRHPERRVDFHSEDGLVAQADPALIRQALFNLISNAWKFTAERETACIELGSHREEQGTETFYVRDNGAGFDMEYVDKLFGPFQRLHALSEFRGNGVGLATVKRIIARHDGTVRAEGEVDRGATFYFTLPKTID